MVLRTLLLLAFLLTFFVDCKSPTDEIAESFDTVNASLTKSDSMLLAVNIYRYIKKYRRKERKTRNWLPRLINLYWR